MTKKILVIDDDKIVSKSIDKLLRTKNYGVSVVESGKEALEIITREDFNLIISDIRMPDMGGIETIKRIKEYQNKTDKLKSEFIAITGYADDDAPKEGAELGITNFLLKPFETERFLEAVENSLDGKSQEIITLEEEGRQEIPLQFPKKYFSIEKVVYLEQTNIMGNTYFANYVVWQGEAREAFLMAHPNFSEEMHKNQHVRMITHSVYHRFIQETTFGDIIEIRVKSREIKRCSLVIVFQLYNKKTDSFVGEGWQRLTFIDAKKGTFCTIPTYIRELALPVREDIS